MPNRLIPLSLALGMLFSPLAFARHIHDNDPLAAIMHDDAQWAAPRKDYANQGYSALSQVNRRNIHDLHLAWQFSTGVTRGHEGAPLVIGNILYVHTAFPNNVYALDLDHHQKILWSYFPKQDASVQAILCCDNVSRGLGYGDGKILLQQNNGMLVALDAKTGAKMWEAEVNDPKPVPPIPMRRMCSRTKYSPAAAAANSAYAALSPPTTCATARWHGKPTARGRTARC